jgi:iron complex outermembrane receptor protein
MNMNRSRLPLPVCVSLVLAGAVANSATAQDQPAQRATLEEIVVTAQKREQSLQDAPISISVLSGEDMALKGIGNLRDLQSGAIPSVRIQPFFGRASAPAMTMRGINSGDVTQISMDPAFGIYVDGVYLGRVQGLGTELMDVERLEVLRGPQGTLFGHNSIGGALNIVSRRPSGEFGLRQRVAVKNFGGREVVTNLDLPETAGVAIKVDGLWSERDGWVENPMPSQWNYHEYKKWGVRVSALWEPSDNVDLLYSYDNSRDRSTSGFPHQTSFLDGDTLSPLFTLDDGRQSSAQRGAVLDPSVANAEGHGLTINAGLNDQTQLRSITSYRELSQTQFDQWLGATLPVAPGLPSGRYSLAEVEQDQFSQEFQLLGSHERIEYVAGVFYFQERANDAAVAFFTQRVNETMDGVIHLDLPDTSDMGNMSGGRSSKNNATSKAAYTQVSYTPPVLSDRLEMTAGLRYTIDDKNGTLLTPRIVSYVFRSSRWDPAFTLNYQLTDVVNIYVRWGQAYRAGGANSRSTTYRTFEPEEVVTWEVGLKSELWDRRARLNVAAYHTDYKNLQFTFQSPDNPSASETVNTNDDIVIKGAEIDLTVLPTPDMLVNLSYSFTDRAREPQQNPFTGEFVQTTPGLMPKHAWTASVSYDFRPFDRGVLNTYVDAVYSSGGYTQSFDVPLMSYTLYNARLTLSELQIGNLRGDFAVSLWGRNLTDKEYDVFNYDLNFPNRVNTMRQWYGDPRTYGLELTYRH